VHFDRAVYGYCNFVLGFPAPKVLFLVCTFSSMSKMIRVTC
jgi:hypothetical protein